MPPLKNLCKVGQTARNLLHSVVKVATFVGIVGPPFPVEILDPTYPTKEHTSVAEFGIEYSGPALDEHAMDLQVLGPSLMAINDLCREASRVLNGKDRMDVRVEMKATSQGSFKVILQLTELAEKAAGFLTTFSAPEILTALGIIGAGGLLGLLKRQRGREARQEMMADSRRGGRLSISVQGDNNRIVVAPEVGRLYHDQRVRRAQRQVFAPLEEEGIEKIRLVSGDGRPVRTIHKDDFQNGHYDVRAEELGNSEEAFSSLPVSELELRLRTAVFEKGKKWRFSYGRKNISAIISDQRFWNRVFEDGEQFGAGQRFRVRLRTTREVLPSGRTRNNYEIVQVLDIKPYEKERRR